MWLALKYAAGRAKLPTDAMLADQLGTPEDARRYKRLVRDYPEVERGPDQEISAHYQALKHAHDRENAEVGESAGVPVKGDRGMARSPEDLGMKRRPPPPQRSWIRDPDEIAAEQASTPTDLQGMPQRIPGQWVGPTEMGGMPPRSFIPGGGDLPKRQPGRYTAPVGYSPGAGPQPQSRDEWMRGLADKGIYLNGDGSRMTPEQMALPRRMGPPAPRGRDIWSDLIDRPASYPGRHRAAKVVVAYITSVIAGSHDTMTADGWELRGNNGQPPPLGSGAWYQKTIGDKTHVIARDGGDWIHNSGPADAEPNEYGDPEMTGTPRGFSQLGDAVMHAKRGTDQVGFRAVPPTAIHRFNSTWEVIR
jgi:hypothetical protein